MSLSPFPGMDPYLEPHWLDVHTALVVEARRALNRVLPRGLVARAEERVAVESEEDQLKRLGPDVRVFAPSTADPEEASGPMVIEAPYKIVVEVEPIIERYLRVVDEGGQLITVIEFVSPTNKRHPGLVEYRDKRAELIAGGVHLVEIDLVRAGDWRAFMRPGVCPPEAVSLYRATVRTAGRRRGAYLFPIGISEPMPQIPVPLRPSDKPAQLPLQAMLDAVYDDGRYDQTIDYKRPLDPPLEQEYAAVVDELLRARRGG